jgi:hypothetical protein
MYLQVSRLQDEKFSRLLVGVGLVHVLTAIVTRSTLIKRTEACHNVYSTAYMIYALCWCLEAFCKNEI